MSTWLVPGLTLSHDVSSQGFPAIALEAIYAKISTCAYVLLLIRAMDRDVMSELDETRAKILGELIQGARLRAGRSLEDCAQVLGMNAGDLARAEAGEKILSLPHLEVLAMYLGVPMSFFWGSETPALDQLPDYKGYMTLRQRIIGVLLRQARIQAKRSLQEVAEQLEVDTGRVEAYEMGAEVLPYFELERMANVLGVSLDYFSDRDRGPLTRHESELAMQKNLRELPPDIRAFVTGPINVGYLETAMRLSEMDVDRLRIIAESILDITY